MSSTHKFIGIGVLAGLLLGGAYYAYAKQDQHTEPQSSSPQTYHVSLLGDHAEPADMLIHTGDTVIFESKDGLTHNLAQGHGNGDGDDHDHAEAGLESGDFGADEAYRYTFANAGAYFFHDHEHPDISVFVAVYAPGKE